MKGESALHSYTIRDVPYGETGAISAFLYFKHYPLEDLSTLFLLLPYLKSYLNGIARADGGDIGVGFPLG